MARPSEICKQEGLKGLKELSEITTKPEQTLIGWARRSPILFYILVLGAVKKKELEQVEQEQNEN